MKRYIFSLPEELYDWFKDNAQRKGEATSSSVRRALRLYRCIFPILPMCCKKHRCFLQTELLEENTAKYLQAKRKCPLCP